MCMLTSRRSFFALLAAAFVLDPERLLWKPGAKLISVPAPLPGVIYGVQFELWHSAADIATLYHQAIEVLRRNVGAPLDSRFLRYSYEPYWGQEILRIDYPVKAA